MSFEKIVLVTRKTRLAGLIERFNTRAQAKFYLERAGDDFEGYVAEDDAYRRSLDAIRTGIEVGLKVHVIDRALLPTFTFTDRDLIVTTGQDGLVANTAKYVGAQPIVGVNPDPSRIDGVLLPFAPRDVRSAIARVTAGNFRVREVTLAEARLRDGQRLLGFNDLFLGARTHVSARYRIAYGDAHESQSSSGVIVSTGAGSTGWLSSVWNMVRGAAHFAGTEITPPGRFAWDERRLMFVVREPFVSRHSSAAIVAGSVDAAHALTVESRMPTGGVIFSDGVEEDFLAFDAGAIATIGVAAQAARLVRSD